MWKVKRYITKYTIVNNTEWNEVPSEETPYLEFGKVTEFITLTLDFLVVLFVVVVDVVVVKNSLQESNLWMIL